MRRIRFALLTLVFAIALPATAGAQLPYVPGPLVDPGLVTPPESVKIGCGQFMNVCSPPSAAMRSAVGRSIK